MNQATSTSYTAEFFDEQSGGSRRSAAVVVPIVGERVHPQSVLDVGCGVGTWLAEWIKSGIKDVVGLDGEYVDLSALQIPAKNFRASDLRESFSLGRRFDLVESLEVAEHLDEVSADGFVESLCAHSDNILFSAAVPGQGGTHHVNEQWPSYWADKFAQFGYGVIDAIRPAIWSDRRVEVWYRQNTILLAKGAPIGPARMLDVLHPEVWDWERHHSPNLSLGQVVRRFPKIFAKAARKRLS